MSNYLAWDKTIITDFNPDNIASLYNRGFLFTREQRGSMYQTRSLRIVLDRFTPNSENRRILNKVADLAVKVNSLPLVNYDWQIHKLGKDYYETKFGPNVFSANKIKEIITSAENLNFNTLLTYTLANPSANEIVGYAISYLNFRIMHYAYPFYDLKRFANNYGMGMMLKAILYCKEIGIKYIYLGSASRPADIYKLQFEGLEWFDGQSWLQDLDKLKTLLASA